MISSRSRAEPVPSPEGGSVMRRAVTVVGIGEDGCAGLSARAAGAVATAHVLVGGERQLEFFPQFRGERIVLKGGLGAAIERIAERA